MRVALYFPDGSVAAYRLGRIQAQVNVITGETIDVPDVVDGLMAAARTEHPDAEVVLERLVDNGDETSTWLPAGDE